MNKITVQSNGVSFTVETDATEFSVAGVEFKFSAAKSRFEPNSEGRQAMFVRAGRTNESTIACIRAMRIAMAEELDLPILKNMVEKSKIFLISPARQAVFEDFCRLNNLYPTYP